MMRPGYVETEVDRVMHRLAEELGRLISEKSELRDQVRALQSQVEGHWPRCRRASRPCGSWPARS